MIDRPKGGATGPRVLFMGTPDFAVGVLQAVLEAGIHVPLVVTVPDRPAGRGRKPRASEVKAFAQKHEIPLLQPERLKEPSFLEELQRYQFDIGLVVAFRMLPEVVVRIPRLGFFNVHASLLPQLRGAAPIQWALIHGLNTTGVTTFLLNSRMDEGDILLQSSCTVGEHTTAGELHDTLMEMGGTLAVETIQGLWHNKLTPKKQPQLENLYVATKLFRADGLMEFTRPAHVLHNLCRGLSPYPGVWCYMHVGDEAPCTVKLFTTDVVEGWQGVAGESHLATEGKALDVLCGDGAALRIHEIQPAGKKRMTMEAYLHGASPEAKFFSAQENR